MLVRRAWWHGHEHPFPDLSRERVFFFFLFCSYPSVVCSCSPPALSPVALVFLDGQPDLRRPRQARPKTPAVACVRWVTLALWQALSTLTVPTSGGLGGDVRQERKRCRTAEGTREGHPGKGHPPPRVPTCKALPPLPPSPTSSHAHLATLSLLPPGPHRCRYWCGGHAGQRRANTVKEGLPSMPSPGCTNGRRVGKPSTESLVMRRGQACRWFPPPYPPPQTAIVETGPAARNARCARVVQLAQRCASDASTRPRRQTRPPDRGDGLGGEGGQRRSGGKGGGAALRGRDRRKGL